MKKLPLRHRPKCILRLPDLDHSETAVLSTLSSPDSQRAYCFAIEDFVAWYCSEPRLAFNKIVALRYRLQLEAPHPSPSTINGRRPRDHPNFAFSSSKALNAIGQIATFSITPKRKLGIGGSET
jgi:hypothetical protein